VQSNDKIALISNNRWEWATVVYATFGLGAQIVPMYEAQLESDWTYIIKDSDAKVLIVSTEAIYNVVKNYVDKVCRPVKQFLLLGSSFMI
jgi:long-chain acyl-CoA synthetase